MKKLFLIGIKDLKLMFRDRAALTFMLLAPFLLTIGMGFVTGRFSGNSSGLSDIPVIIVNQDQQELGNALADLFNSADLADLLEPAASDSPETAHADLCKSKGLKLHLDGARIFNALVETGEDTNDWGRHFDTISICMSKGLGAPVGSLLLGDKETIREARRFRKVMRGGMRQAGYLAAACIYALDNHIDNLKIDNDKAKKIGLLLSQMPYVKSIKPVFTNILIFELQDNIKDTDFLEKLKSKGILATAFGNNTIRFVFHLQITDEMVTKISDVLESTEL